jgi:hypothetical protein
MGLCHRMKIGGRMMMTRRDNYCNKIGRSSSLGVEKCSKITEFIQLILLNKSSYSLSLTDALNIHGFINYTLRNNRCLNGWLATIRSVLFFLLIFFPQFDCVVDSLLISKHLFNEHLWCLLGVMTKRNHLRVFDLL